jgi:hypothetical protein
MSKQMSPFSCKIKYSHELVDSPDYRIDQRQAQKGHKIGKFSLRPMSIPGWLHEAYVLFLNANNTQKVLCIFNKK